MPNEQLLFPPYILNSQALEIFLGNRLKKLLQEPLSLSEDESLNIKLNCPAPEEISLAIKANLTIKASLEIQWTGSKDIIRFTFPYPQHGVFIIHSDSSRDGRPSQWVWHPRLMGKPGLWFIRKHSYKNGIKIITEFVRLVLSRGTYLDYDIEKKPENFWIPATLIFPSMYSDEIEGNCSELLKNHNLFSSSSLFVSKKERKTITKELSHVMHQFLDNIKSSGIQPIDEQDIKWQRLLTYSAFIADRLLEFFARAIWGRQKNATPERLWEILSDISNSISLVPISDLMKSGWLHYFSPINGTEAISQLTSFQRYNYNKDIIERLPAVFRQNHSSFKGYICPVESPESKKVGITLHLAREVLADVIGQLHPSTYMTGDRDLGYAASLVPFYQHNDGPRSMMGAKNLKQALPIRGSLAAKIKTGFEEKILSAIKPLADLKMIPEHPEPAPGVDLLVAYMPWYGFNMEDAIIANKRLVDDGFLDWAKEEDYFQYILPGYQITKPLFANSFEEAFKALLYNDNGLRKPGLIKPQSPLVFLKDPESEDIIPILYEGEDEGELLEIKFNPPTSNLFGGSLSFKVRAHFPLMVGDKIMGRYGNKGVISAILPHDELPKLPDDPRLPEELRGRSVDLVLNPHGVISRMNLGQLLETSLGLMLRLKKGDQAYYPSDIGKPFSEVDLDHLRSDFLSINKGKEEPLIDEYGRMRLILPNGKPTKAPVTLGFQYIVRLKHVADRKAQVRGWPKQQKSYPYNIVTGQPVGGRRNKGGQRLGEMEMWALAAHRASLNLECSLKEKSDPMIHSKKIPLGQTFQAIQDHLFAMAINLIPEKNSKIRLDWASPEIIDKKGKELINSSTWTVGVKGKFVCAKDDCAYHFPDEVQATGKSERGSDIRVTVEDALQAYGFRFFSSLDEKIPPFQGTLIEGEIETLLQPINIEKKNKPVKILFKRQKRSIQIIIKFGKNSVTAYGQDDKSNQEFPLQKIAKLWLTCPRHKTSYLVCKKQHVVPIALNGGLCDPDIFGQVNVCEWDPDAWGYVRLPMPIPYPRTDKKSKGALRFSDSDCPPDLTVIPVLPLKYRFRGPRRFGSVIIPQQDKLTRKYQELNDLVKMKAPPGKIQMCIKSLFEIIHGRLFGKYGLLRRDGLGRRVDASARLVIVPDPMLDWDACGVPTEILMVLLGPKIAGHPDLFKGLVQDNAVDRLIELIFGLDCKQPDIKKETEDFILNEEFWQGVNWPNKKLSDEHLLLAYQVICSYLEEFPETTVILNRQPSLHRYSIMAFRPLPMPPQAGMVLKINPLVCKGFGADFDGDEMTIHLPITEEAQTEAEEMKPAKPWNLISWANGQPLANFDQDFVAGHYLLSKTALNSVLPNSCAVCKKIISETIPWEKAHGEKLLLHICKDHSDKASEIITEWMQLAFEEVTEHGLSFGFLELKRIEESLKNQTNEILNNIGNDEDLSELTNKAGETVSLKLKEIVSQPANAPGHGFAILAVSGARGAKQTRQIVGARGFLSPGETGYSNNATDFFLKESLITGMGDLSAFMAAMNARSSMVDKKLGTGKAGDLTRQLVLAGWEWTVRQGDCKISENIPRKLTQCLWKENHQICSTCYGKIDGYDQIPDNYPAGLIAAQSFGERGTQLSMQSFHTAEKQLSIDEFIALLHGKDTSAKSKQGYNWFIQKTDDDLFIDRIRKEKAYNALDKRHILLIWLIIHMSADKNLASAWQSSRSAISGLIGPGQWQAMLEAIREKKEDDLSSPFVKLITSCSPIPLAC